MTRGIAVIAFECLLDAGCFRLSDAASNQHSLVYAFPIRKICHPARPNDSAHTLEILLLPVQFMWVALQPT